MYDFLSNISVNGSHGPATKTLFPLEGTLAAFADDDIFLRAFVAFTLNGDDLLAVKVAEGFLETRGWHPDDAAALAARLQDLPRLDRARFVGEGMGFFSMVTDVPQDILLASLEADLKLNTSDKECSDEEKDYLLTLFNAAEHVVNGFYAALEANVPVSEAEASETEAKVSAVHEPSASDADVTNVN
jgi:hypothetical protein